MKRLIGVLLLCIIVLLSQLVLSCGDTTTDGDVKDKWTVDVMLARNGENNTVSVYAELTKNDEPFGTAVLQVDEQGITSNANGKYQATFSASLLADTSEISITSPIDEFQFKQLVVVPDSFSFDFDQLPDNQVFSSTNVVNVRWNASDFEGMSGSYFVVVEPTNAANPAIGGFELFDGRIGSIPRDAFRDSQGNYRTGTYSVWVVSRVQEPFDTPNLPFTIPGGIFTENINRVGVTGQIGAIYISPHKTITAVAGS